jgi:hypothetical protein
VLERIQAEAFPEAFRRFNGSAADDPGGANTRSGNTFAVPGLSARRDDPDGQPGEVVFPTLDAAPGQLIESVNMASLGMPRDLNGDGAIHATADYSTSYVLLPVLVRVRWEGAAGRRKSSCAPCWGTTGERARPRTDGARRAGFSVIELVLAVAMAGGADRRR